MPLSPNPEGEGGTSDSEPLSFETAFEQLQQVVERLEDGGLGLEDAMRAYERGSRLAQMCERRIDEAELRVTRLTAEAPSPLSDT
jgi:exodeoxyribonuclease VII small subunit